MILRAGDGACCFDSAGSRARQQRYWHDRSFATVDRVRAFADERNTSMAKLGLAWVLANPTITSATRP
jgi:aryl-alcohol dehydrogenase-like predicted oxidoreductase